MSSGVRVRMCRTCREKKPFEDFPSLQARRCFACKAVVEELSRCKVCRERVPLSGKGEPRFVCKRPECRREALRSSQAAAAEARREAFAALTTKVCPGCDIEKDRILKNFSPRGFRDDGLPRFDHLCRPCRAAIVRDRYQSYPGTREKAIERAKQQRVDRQARMDADPEYAVEYREHKRQLHLHRQPRATPTRPPDRLSATGGQTLSYNVVLPPGPLIRAVESWALRQGDMGMTGTVTPINRDDAFPSNLGVTPRAVYRWADSRESSGVRFDTADRVLLGLGREWWEVWDPAEFPEVEALFEDGNAEPLRKAGWGWKA